MSIARSSSPWKNITILIVACCLTLPTQAKYGGGSGTEEDPYQIWDVNHMQAIGADANDWDKCFKLMADIDLSAFTGTQFNIIGYWKSSEDNAAFNGIFDGNGNKISNFTYISTGTSYIGLFGYVSGYNAEIKNLGLINPSVSAGGVVGSLVGFIEAGSISNCYFKGGTVSGNWSIGGLVGWNHDGIITTSYSAGSVSGNYVVGGLVGENWEGTIANCYATGRVEGEYIVGGLVGDNYYNNGTISNCYATGSVVVYIDGGGLVGYNSGTITNCYTIGSVTGEEVGGFVGFSDGSVTDSFWDTETSGQNWSDGGRGLPTADMQTTGTFVDVGWDFVSIWDICEGTNYPKLSWQIPKGDLLCPDGVNFFDFSFFAGHWAEDNCGASNDCEGTDLNLLGTVEINDLRIFVDNWLRDF